MLRVIDFLPPALLECSAKELWRHLEGPTLIHLDGGHEPPLFVSVLMHGNEDVGLKAVQCLLRQYRVGGGSKELPRSMSIFIGNIEAARVGMRRLPGQPDYNRVWPGSEDTCSEEARMMQQVYDLMRERGLFASIDIHNNTGLNPHYGCVNRLDHRFFHLAALFSRTLVYFIRPKGVQSMTFVDICPSITLECGRVGQQLGVEHATQYLDACLHLSQHPDHPINARDMDLFHSVALVKIPEKVSFSLSGGRADLSFVTDIDRFNFRELLPGTVLAQVAEGCRVEELLDALDETGRNVTAEYFSIHQGQLVNRRVVMPSMLTLNAEVVNQDCLCYLMERIDPKLYCR
jgi:succinylglutamate desuccinylase